jgi:hypothetical protein
MLVGGYRSAAGQSATPAELVHAVPAGNRHSVSPITLGLAVMHRVCDSIGGRSNASSALQLARSEMAGSTDTARRVGRRHARRATTMVSDGTARNVAGSSVSTP